MEWTRHGWWCEACWQFVGPHHVHKKPPPRPIEALMAEVNKAVFIPIGDGITVLRCPRDNCDAQWCVTEDVDPLTMRGDLIVHLVGHQYLDERQQQEETTMTVFDRGKNSYKSDLQLGERYRDKTTDIEGHLVGIHFYEHACERATLRYVNGQQEVVEVSFDAPELVHVPSGAIPVVSRTGGPARSEGTRRTPTR